MSRFHRGGRLQKPFLRPARRRFQVELIVRDCRQDAKFTPLESLVLF